MNNAGSLDAGDTARKLAVLALRRPRITVAIVVLHIRTKGTTAQSKGHEIG